MCVCGGDVVDCVWGGMNACMRARARVCVCMCVYAHPGNFAVCVCARARPGNFTVCVGDSSRHSEENCKKILHCAFQRHYDNDDDDDDDDDGDDYDNEDHVCRHDCVLRTCSCTWRSTSTRMRSWRNCGKPSLR